MQTFLPYADFNRSAACLDNKRLNKQIVECKQIVMALRGETKAWANHPAVLMWKGYEFALLSYGSFLCSEYKRKNQKEHTCHLFILLAWCKTYPRKLYYPRWFGYEPFHAMHRAVLLDKDPAWYGRFGWTEEPAKKNAKGSYPYLWPSKMEEFKA